MAYSQFSEFGHLWNVIFLLECGTLLSTLLFTDGTGSEFRSGKSTGLSSLRTSTTGDGGGTGRGTAGGSITGGKVANVEVDSPVSESKGTSREADLLEDLDRVRRDLKETPFG